MSKKAAFKDTIFYGGVCRTLYLIKNGYTLATAFKYDNDQKYMYTASIKKRKCDIDPNDPADTFYKFEREMEYPDKHTMVVFLKEARIEMKEYYKK